MAVDVDKQEYLDLQWWYTSIKPLGCAAHSSIISVDHRLIVFKIEHKKLQGLASGV